MTVAPCPRGCGGFVDTAKDESCPSCRRPLNGVTVMESKPEGACWQWWGPVTHRMRCRRSAGHQPPDAHFDHSDEETGNSVVVDVDGNLVAASLNEEGK